MTRIPNSVNKQPPATIKFLYSSGGKILPRKIDGKLRYVGGRTRVLAVDRGISYAELIVKFWEACDFSVNLKCKLPSEDLDVLVSVTCDEDLAAVLKEYDRVSPDAKIRAVLCPIKSLKTISPVPSFESLVDISALNPPPYPGMQQRQAVGFSASNRPPYPGKHPGFDRLRRCSLAGSCRDYPPLASRFRQETIPKNFIFLDSNIRW